MAEILIAGSTGGREHALGLALEDGGANSLEFTHGGNGGTRNLGNGLPITDIEEIADYAAETDKELVVIGPEAPLVDGLADRLRERGVATFGPGVDGAELEASKAFTAEFCEEFGIRQPEYAVADDLYHEALARVVRYPQQYVIKADGLTGGKGVVLPETDDDASRALVGMLTGKLYNGAGKRVVIQRRLPAVGPEVSAMYVLDGKDFTLLPLSQDHKRLLDDDRGPNTGGMGAYTPLPFEDGELIDDLMDIGDRLVSGLIARGIDYRGVAYAGAMRDVTNDNRPSVLEMNVRFGDPETQVLMASLGKLGINAYDLLSSAAQGSLDPRLRGKYLGSSINIGQAAVTICLAAEGYPESPIKGEVIDGLDRAYPHVTVHHGGTKIESETQLTVTSGGRVLYVTAVGANLQAAQNHAYAAIGEGNINFDGMQYRSDIADKALITENRR